MEKSLFDLAIEYTGHDKNNLTEFQENEIDALVMFGKHIIEKIGQQIVLRCSICGDELFGRWQDDRGNVTVKIIPCKRCFTSISEWEKDEEAQQLKSMYNDVASKLNDANHKLSEIKKLC